MLTRKQKQRLNHKDFGEYLTDVSAHWGELVRMETILWHSTTRTRIMKRLDEMEDRFRKTFYPQLEEQDR